MLHGINTRRGNIVVIYFIDMIQSDGYGTVDCVMCGGTVYTNTKHIAIARSKHHAYLCLDCYDSIIDLFTWLDIEYDEVDEASGINKQPNQDV